MAQISEFQSKVNGETEHHGGASTWRREVWLASGWPRGREEGRDLFLQKLLPPPKVPLPPDNVIKLNIHQYINPLGQHSHGLVTSQ